VSGGSISDGPNSTSGKDTGNMESGLSSKQHWRKSIARQKEASNLLSDRLRKARRVIKAQAIEIGRLRSTWTPPEDSVPEPEGGEVSASEMLEKGTQ